MIKDFIEALEETEQRQVLYFKRAKLIRDFLIANWPTEIEATAYYSDICSGVSIELTLINPEDSHIAVATCVRLFGEGTKRFYADAGYFYWIFASEIEGVSVSLSLNRVSSGKCQIVKKTVTREIWESVCPGQESETAHE